MSAVRVLIGDLFESEAQTLTNTVNTVGVMGKGIALGFKKRFPDMFNDYVLRCERGEIRLGEPYLYKPLIPPWILNFPTKGHWRSATRLTDIQTGLDYLVAHYRDWGIESIAVPPLGCGEGMLEWRVVGPTLFRGLSKLDIPVGLYAPFGTPHHELAPEFLTDAAEVNAPEPRIPAGAVALAAIVDRITSEKHHYPIGRTIFQKIAYFATQAGVPTGLEFERRSYGPFSEDLTPLKTRLERNGLLSEEQTGQMFQVQPGPTLHDAERGYSEDLAEWQDRLEEVVDLFLRLPSSRDAEAAASAHFVALQLAEHSHARGAPPPTETDVVSEVLSWKARRKPQLNEGDVTAAVRTLSFLGWIDTALEESDDLATV